MTLKVKRSRSLMKTYSGKRDKNNVCVVHVIQADGDSRLLNPRLDLFNHSPTGFEWGYAGSGPAQLALAILADCLTDDKLAVRLHQRFKFLFIAKLERSQPWIIHEEDVVKFVVGAIKENGVSL